MAEFMERHPDTWTEEEWALFSDTQQNQTAAGPVGEFPYQEKTDDSFLGALATDLSRGLSPEKYLIQPVLEKMGVDKEKAGNIALAASIVAPGAGKFNPLKWMKHGKEAILKAKRIREVSKVVKNTKNSTNLAKKDLRKILKDKKFNTEEIKAGLKYQDELKATLHLKNTLLQSGSRSARKMARKLDSPTMSTDAFLEAPFRYLGGKYPKVGKYGEKTMDILRGTGGFLNPLHRFGPGPKTWLTGFGTAAHIPGAYGRDKYQPLEGDYYIDDLAMNIVKGAASPFTYGFDFFTGSPYVWGSGEDKKEISTKESINMDKYAKNLSKFAAEGEWGKIDSIRNNVANNNPILKEYMINKGYVTE